MKTETKYEVVISKDGCKQEAWAIPLNNKDKLGQEIKEIVLSYTNEGILRSLYDALQLIRHFKMKGFDLNSSEASEYYVFEPVVASYYNREDYLRAVDKNIPEVLEVYLTKEDFHNFLWDFCCLRHFPEETDTPEELVENILTTLRRVPGFKLNWVKI